MIEIKQISLMHKIRNVADFPEQEICDSTCLKGERFYYQLAIFSAKNTTLLVDVMACPDVKVSIYEVGDVVMDYAGETDDYVITKEKGLMPDLLIPLEMKKGRVNVAPIATLLVEADILKTAKTGALPIEITLTDTCENATISKIMELDIIDVVMPKQKTKFTQWFHTDCIAEAHNVPIYSEKHWELIDKYMALAARLGVNMLLTPVITPELDIEVGGRRANVQLTDITFAGGKYSFDFSRLKRWIELCRKNNIEYFEISHLFSQWGVKYTPSIEVVENGKKHEKFGWHVEAKDSSYREFLESFLPALLLFLDNEGIKDKCYFHISDEPFKEHFEAYRYAYDIVKPLIGDCKIIDAISDIEFYDNGMIDVPATATDHIEPFLERNIENQFAYYCCAQGNKVGNRFLCMPLSRSRILGLQLYKHDVKGFLHWGYNFYKSRNSRYNINPYITTSADREFPSGDAFSVYPWHDMPLPSIRAIVFYAALQDIEICRTLEKLDGKNNVMNLIGDISFSVYPREDDFIPDLIEKIKQKIKERTEEKC